MRGFHFGWWKKTSYSCFFSATGNGKILPPMIIFKGKTDRTISDLNISAGFTVKSQEKAWMDDGLMKVWVEDISIKHIWAECEKLWFENALLTFDAFAAHLADDAESQLLEAKTDTLAIPAGCSYKYQHMDVCLNKPFKAISQKCWVNDISSVVETFPDPSQDPSFKISSPTQQKMVDWVKEAFDYLTRNQEMVIWGLWDYVIRYRKDSKCWILQTVYERCARKFGKWSRRRRRRPFHFVDGKKIRILTENNNCVVVSNFS